MFDTIVARPDPDAWWRWPLAAVLTVVGLGCAGGVALVMRLLGLALSALQVWLRWLWALLTLQPVPAVVAVQPPPDLPSAEIEVEVVEPPETTAWRGGPVAEPDDLIGEAPPPPPPEPVRTEVASAQRLGSLLAGPGVDREGVDLEGVAVIGVLGTLGSVDEGVMNVFSSSPEDSAALGALLAEGSGGGGLGVAGGTPGPGIASGIGGLGTRLGEPGERPRRLVLRADDLAPGTRALCDVAPRGSDDDGERLAVTGCPRALHDRVLARVERARRTHPEADRFQVRVLGPPPSAPPPD